MAHFERVPYPGRPGYSVTDDYGHTAELSTEQAYELLAWLDQYRDEMFEELHPERNLAKTHERMVQALDALVTKQEEAPEDYSNYARSTFLEIDQEGR